MEEASGSQNKSPIKAPGSAGAGGTPTKPKNWVHFAEDGENGPANLDRSENLEDGVDNDESATENHHPAVIEPSIEIHSPTSASAAHNHSNNTSSKSIAHPLSISSSSTSTRPDGTIIHTGQLQNVELQNPGDNKPTTYNSSAQNFNNGNRRNNSGFSKNAVYIILIFSLLFKSAI